MPEGVGYKKKKKLNSIAELQERIDAQAEGRPRRNRKPAMVPKGAGGGRIGGPGSVQGVGGRGVGRARSPRAGKLPPKDVKSRTVRGKPVEGPPRPPKKVSGLPSRGKVAGTAAAAGLTAGVLSTPRDTESGAKGKRLSPPGKPGMGGKGSSAKPVRGASKKAARPAPKGTAPKPSGGKNPDSQKKSMRKRMDEALGKVKSIEDLRKKAARENIRQEAIQRQKRRQALERVDSMNKRVDAREAEREDVRRRGR